MKVSRETCLLIRDQMIHQAEEWLAQNGLKAEAGRVTYSDEGYLTFKMKVMEVDEHGKALSPERVAFQQKARRYGLNPDWLDKTFISRGLIHQIVGLNTRAKRMPVMTIASDGNAYKFTAHFVLTIMREGSNG